MYINLNNITKTEKKEKKDFIHISISKYIYI